MFNPKFIITSEILNNLNAIEVIKTKIATCKIHPKEELLFKKSGHYRREPVYVVKRNALSTQVVYTCPPHKEVPKLVSSLCKWIK